MCMRKPSHVYGGKAIQPFQQVEFDKNVDVENLEQYKTKCGVKIVYYNEEVSEKETAPPPYGEIPYVDSYDMSESNEKQDNKRQRKVRRRHGFAAIVGMSVIFWFFISRNCAM